MPSPILLKDATCRIGGDTVSVPVVSPIWHAHYGSATRQRLDIHLAGRTVAQGREAIEAALGLRMRPV
jgi:hypothetical protein